MSYVVLARRFRPQTFDHVVGQDHVSATLKNAVAAGRLAHAYLFSGPRGVGKTSMARILAKAFNCHSTDKPTPQPCGKCPSCLEIAEGSSLDVVEMDAASHTGVDDVRLLREGALYAAARDRFKVYIIDEAHMMSRSAFNALLKVLEEPPGHVKFIFATTEPERLPDTILSRCQRFDFRRISVADALKRLEQIAGSEKLEAEPAALAAIARRARGGLRDAEGLLDQLISFRGKQRITLGDVLEMAGAVSDAQTGKLLAAVREGRAGGVLEVLAECLEAGAELGEVASALADRLRGALLVAAAGKESALVSGEYAHLAGELAAEAGKASVADLVRMNSVLAEARRAMRSSPEPRIVLELALVRLASLPELVDLRALVEGLGSAAAPKAPAPAPPAPAPAPAPAPKAGKGQVAPRAPQAAPGEESSPFLPGAGASPRRGAASGDLAAKWNKFRAAVAEVRSSTNSFLEPVRPVSLKGGRLTLEVGAGGLFQREQLESVENRGILEQAAARVFGRPVKVTFRSGGENGPEPSPGGGGSPAPAPQAGSGGDEVRRAAGQPAVRKLMGKFDGRVVKVRKQKK